MNKPSVKKVFDAVPFIAAVGVISITVGAALLNRPLGFIVFGSLCLLNVYANYRMRISG